MAQNGPFSDAFTDAFNNTDSLNNACLGSFSDAFSDAFHNCTGGILPPIGNRCGLRHFRAGHFSKLRHFYACHLAGYEVTVEVIPPGGGGGGSRKLPKGYIPLQDHLIIVRITKDDQTWEASYTWSKYFAEPVITILAKLSAFRAMVQNIIVRVIGNKVNTKDKVDVTVKKL